MANAVYLPQGYEVTFHGFFRNSSGEACALIEHPSGRISEVPPTWIELKKVTVRPLPPTCAPAGETPIPPMDGQNG